MSVFQSDREKGIARVPAEGGELVYLRDGNDQGRRLVGFTDVTDWSALRVELSRRGIGVGAIHHLPVFEDEGDR